MSGSNKLSRSTRGVTATADQVNAALTAATLTAAEVAVIDDVVAGTAAASKALVLGTTKGATGLGAFAHGAKANIAGSGIVLTGDDYGAFRVFTDDNGVSIAASVRGIQGRVLLTLDQAAGSIRAVQGQVKWLDLIDCTTGVYTAVQGYNELAGTHVCKTGAVWSCFDASVEIATSLTIDSGGRFAGVHIETTGAGTITNSGTCAALLIDKATGAASWPVAVKIDCDSVTKAIEVGSLGSNVTSGVPIANATAINGFYSDDNGADQTAGVRMNVRARTYFSIDQTVAASDYYTIRGHIKAASGIDFGGDTSVKACVNGYSEFAGITIIGAGSFYASVLGEIWGDNSITGTGKAAGVMARLYTAAGTASGTLAGVMVTKHFASTQVWPYGLYIDAATCDIRLANASGAGIYSRATTPNGALTAPKGSICLCPNGSAVNDRIWVNTDGGTTWTFVTTGA